VTGPFTRVRSQGEHLFRHLVPHRSPDQPWWARPILLALTGLATLLYAWRSSGYLEIYYAAAVRSMAMSWHNFFFASFDPIGSISTDKLPGAFWVQALSVRLFGLHDWAIALPQIVEGVLTVLVLYRCVRRLAGPAAGIIAATVLVLSPANVTLNRGNVSDSLMILLVVLAANATVSALNTGRLRHVAFAAFWVGLAFQAKMIEAWLILPAIALVILVAAPGRLRRRAVCLALLGIVTMVVSLSWILAVEAQPGAERPYVDGSRTDSVFEQVFNYNGFGRLHEPSSNAVLFKTLGLGSLPSGAPGWNRLFIGAFGHDTGWLIPASLLAFVAGLIARRGHPRGDPLRAALLLWGGWLITLMVVFSVSTTINSYYLAALTPGIAGLIASGLTIAWKRRSDPLTRILVAASVLGTATYGAWLLPTLGIGITPSLATAALVIGFAVALVLVGSIFVPGGRAAAAIFGLAVASMLVIPTAASASAVANRLGCFDTPFEFVAFANSSKFIFGTATLVAARKMLPELLHLQLRFRTRYLMATETAVAAAPTIFETGREVYPLGGYDGTGAAPTLAAMKRLIASNDFRIVLAAAHSSDPRYRWIEQHCRPLGTTRSTNGFSLYFCGPG